MSVNEKILEKEKKVRELLETLRNNLNNKRLAFNNKPNDWAYITSLSFTEKKLQEILEYFDSEPK